MALSEYSKRLLGAYAEQPFLMAPMAGVTDPAYRIMCRRRGANLAYSEMVSVAGLAYASNKTWRLVLPADEEQQICVQLFGSKPDQFASAVAAVEERVGDRLSLIDINMACPARKVVTKGEGSALMRTPDLAEKIVEATVGAAHVPVTVKIRKGFYAEDRNAATFAQMLEGAGAAAVAVHGRCATQLYTGQADWSVVDEVADAVEIPVIGSGDVFSAEDAAEHLQSSGASAVFIARGIYGNPWVFGDARALALDGTPVPSRSSVERLEALREHLTLTHELLPLMSRARTYASWYLKGMPHAAAWRAQVVRCSTYEEFMALVDDIERDVVVCEAALAAGEPVPAHPLEALGWPLPRCMCMCRFALKNAAIATLTRAALLCVIWMLRSIPILSSCMRASIPLATPGRLRRSARSILAAARHRWQGSAWWNLPGVSPCGANPLNLLAKPILSP